MTTMPTLSVNGVMPSGTRKPGFYANFNTKNAINSLPGNAIEVLLVGQMLSAGSVAANTLQPIYSVSDAESYFGTGSMLHLMALAAFKANAYLSLKAIGLVDASSSVAATWALTVAGTSTVDNAMQLQIGATFIPFSISNGDTAATVAANIKAQITQYPNLPVVATISGSVLTLTAKNKGSIANQLAMSLLKSAAVTGQSGLTFTLAQGVTGVIDPDITPALTTAFSSGVNIVVSGWNNAENLTALSTFLENVSSPIEGRGCIGVSFVTSTLSSATSLAAGLNEGRITIGLLRKAPNLSYELAAMYGAVIASEADPAMPLNTLALSGAVSNPPSQWLSRTEQEACLANGITPFEIGPANSVQIVRAITTYTQNALSTPDPSLLDLATIRSLDYTRLAILTRMKLRFPRSKLSNRTADRVRSEILDVLYQLEAAEIIENVKANAPQLLIGPDPTTPTQLNAVIPANVVPGLMIFAAQIDLII